MYTAEQLTASVKTLASLPLVYQHIKQVLDDPDSSLADLVSVIDVDPGLTARLLKLVNSPFFGFQRKIETVSRAVNLLGTKQVHDLALATSVTALFHGMTPARMNMGRFWHYSVYCGLAARELARRSQLLDGERLFVEGLLCDIGHLVIYEKVPELAEQAMAITQRDGTPLFHAERAVIGCDYAQVGAALMEGWNLPAAMQLCVRYHIEPAETSECSLEASLIHIARLMASAADAGQDIEQNQLPVDPLAWQLTRLDAECIPLIHQQMERETLAVVNSLFSSSAKIH